MPSLSMYKITPPTDYVEFEKMCRDYLKHRYNADAQLWGRKGQKQSGVDIVVTLDDNSFVFAQCKDVCNVSVNDLDKWIAKAEECQIPMKEFIILVSVDHDVALQEHICKVASSRVNQGKCPVRLFFWEDILSFIKENQTMLRLYYPELYQGQIEILTEAAKKPETKYPEIIKGENKLRGLFFEEAVRCRIEEFLECDPTNGVPCALAYLAEVFALAIKKLFYRSPTLIDSFYYLEIKQFYEDLSVYHEFLVNVTESTGQGSYVAINRYHTKEEYDDLKEMHVLREKALKQYNAIKELY